MKLKKIYFFIALAWASNAQSGAGGGTVEIEHVGKWEDKDLVFFYTNTHTSEPECNSYRKRWVLELTSDIGKAQYSLLLASQMAGKEVRLSGTGNCNLFENSESVSWVAFPVNYNNHPE
ncbi:hypothetical protein P886_3433 [Alteromonadaceae bacterium 2753L.S.0a.02]|nr:hypothetical protein P886_3433 [Alteromonadaceae bacterium 2753L.S.0a.02]